MGKVSSKGTLLFAKVLIYGMLATLVGALEVWAITCVFVLFWINELVAEQEIYRDLIDKAVNKDKGNNNV